MAQSQGGQAVSIEEIMAQSQTPRTHSIWNALVNAGSNPVETGRILGAARKMELELKAANERIKRMEEAGDEIIWAFCPASVSMMTERESDALKLWNKAKEDKL